MNEKKYFYIDAHKIYIQKYKHLKFSQKKFYKEIDPHHI